MHMTCRYHWLRSQSRHTEANQLGPCGSCQRCLNQAPEQTRRAGQPKARHMTCRYHWMLSKRREPDMEPCGVCQQCEAKGTRPGQSVEQPEDEPAGPVASEDFPTAEPADPEPLTKPEIIEALEDLGQEVDKRARKADLLQQLELARLQAQAV